MLGSLEERTLILPSGPCLLHFSRPEGQYKAALGFCPLSPNPFTFMREDYLSPEEKLQVEKYTAPKRRLSYLGGRLAAKAALKELIPGSQETDFSLQSGVFQFPVVTSPYHNFQVSIAHSQNMAGAVAFPETHPLGLDMENISPENESSLKEYLGPNEADQIPTLRTTLAGLTLLWSVKEALSKVLKTGLMTPFSLFQTENWTVREGIYACKFTNFPQYKAWGFCTQDLAFALIHPAKSVLDPLSPFLIHLFKG